MLLSPDPITVEMTMAEQDQHRPHHNVRVRPDVFARLEKIAQQRRLSVAWLLNEFAERQLDQEERKAARSRAE